MSLQSLSKLILTYEFLDSLEIYGLDSKVADIARELVQCHQDKGVPLDIVHAVIAATLIANELTLVTLDAQCYPMPEVRLYKLRQVKLRVPSLKRIGLFLSLHSPLNQSHALDYVQYPAHSLP